MCHFGFAEVILKAGPFWFEGKEDIGCSSAPEVRQKQNKMSVKYFKTDRDLSLAIETKI